jgi:hypothetical protein
VSGSTRAVTSAIAVVHALTRLAVGRFGIGEKDQAKIADLDFVAGG